MNGCAPLRMPVIVRNAPIEMYKYAYISPTKELTSSTGGTYGGQYGIYGSSTTKSVNPSDVIAGILIKEGYIILPELKPELSNETLIVNYGDDSFREAGRAGRIVQDSQFLRVFDMIFHIVGGERTGIFLAKIFVDTVAYGAYLLIFAIDNGEVVQHHE